MQIIYNFSEEKNRELIIKRKISFEEIISAIENNSILAVVKHPNSQKYPNQQMYIIEFNHYAYLVPFVVCDYEEIFLKTVIPSHKATKKYLKEVKDDEQ